jgi:hypothetical protein
MSTGKYSPLCPHNDEEAWEVFKYNSYGEIPAEWNDEVSNSGVKFDEKTMFINYDDEGFDWYGYSAFDIDGNYVGLGKGIDRYGYTEMDYLIDAANDGTLHEDLAGWGGDVMTSFKRNR